MRTRLAELHQKCAQQQEYGTREESRRVAVESQIADITIERDCFRLQCATLTAKLMRQDMDINRLRMEQGRACRGCERQPQAPGTADGLDGSDATEVAEQLDKQKEQSMQLKRDVHERSLQLQKELVHMDVCGPMQVFCEGRHVCCTSL